MPDKFAASAVVSPICSRICLSQKRIYHHLQPLFISFRVNYSISKRVCQHKMKLFCVKRYFIL
nr:MAG TPA: hypothetical protein [Bacteriophage sp.]